MRIEIHPDYKQYSDFLNSIPSIFQQEGKSIYEGRNSVKLFSSQGMDFIVKRFKKPNIVQGISYSFFKKSKAERAFLYAGIFRDRGIDTPHEIAFIEIKKNRLLSDSYFICQICSAPSIMEAISSDGFDRDLINELAAFIVRLHESKIFHGDLNLSNILFHRLEGQPTQFTLIDTNRSNIGGEETQSRCLENLVRITHNRELLRYFILQYTSLRGWDSEKCTNFVFSKLDSFENRRIFKRRVKSIIFKSKNKE